MLMLIFLESLLVNFIQIFHFHVYFDCLTA